MYMANPPFISSFGDPSELVALKRAAFILVSSIELPAFCLHLQAQTQCGEAVDTLKSYSNRQVYHPVHLITVASEPPGPQAPSILPFVTGRLRLELQTPPSALTSRCPLA